MKCESCSGKTKVIDTRKNYRRRKCLQCDYIFSTYEVTQMSLLDVFDKHLSDESVDEIADVLDKEYPTDTSKRRFYLKG